MNLEEFIKKEEWLASHHLNTYEFECLRYGIEEDTDLECFKEYMYHNQLAEFLKELKKRRKEDYGYMADIHESIGYRKAINDVINNIENLKTKGYVTGISSNPFEFGACQMADDIIKMLKK